MTLYFTVKFYVTYITLSYEMAQAIRQTPSIILYFEDILPKTGWGLYYKFMLGMACASCFTNAIASLSLPLSIPMSTCENSQMISDEIMYGIHTSFTVGRSVGGFLMNCSCDIYGRKRLMTYSLLTIFLTTFMSAFAYNYYMIICAALFLGSGLECNLAVVKIHLAEILPKRKRGFYLCFCDISWTLGYLGVSVFAVLMRNPAYVEHRAVDMRVSTWRMILALSGGFSLLLACSSALLEESPRYFIHANKGYLSVLTLKQFFAINKSSYGNSFDIKESDIRNLVQDYGLSIHHVEGRIDLAENSLNIIGKSVKLILSEPFRRATLLLLTIKTPLLIFSILNINILLAKMFIESSAENGLDIIHLDPVGNSTMCSSFEDNKILYFHFLVLAVNILLGQIIMMWSLDYLGRTPSLIFSLSLTGISFTVLFYVKNNMTKIIVSSVLILSISAALTTTNVMNIELYPTCVRGTSQGLIQFFGIFLSIFAMRYYYLVSNWFFLIGGYICLCISFFSYFLHDMKRHPMVE
ncbi:uncharacterized protein [Leptinotarsa decemlineata]|uniref:uncharacterized protein n=1 Tax=Leptinotarsa decemlineata TaxID=7539 RepID=UPI003D30AAEF